MKTALFLGAGASAAEGAPIQNQLFKEYFKSARRPNLTPSETEMMRELSEFFDIMFEVKVTAPNLNSIKFPTFEEALGLLDLAEIRREAFKKYELEDFGRYGNRLRLVRKYMVLAMAKAIADSLTRSKRLHRTLLQNLNRRRLLNNTAFISTNYDILIDNAISSLWPNNPGQHLNYGVDFTNFNKGDWSRPDPTAVHLYKLHGSLNWLYCANCNTLTLTPHVKGVIDLITDVDIGNDSAVCRDCHSIMSPIIVPPTFYKDMSRVFLSQIWNKAEQVLRGVDHVIFCGYSFPDADMHIKYLLKRVQTNRPDPAKLKFTVVNHHPGKKKQQADEEKERFQRFLGTDRLDYTKLSFEKFASAPEQLYR